MTYSEMEEMVALRLERQSGFSLTADLAHRRARAILDEIIQHDGLVVDDDAFDPDMANVG